MKETEVIVKTDAVRVRIMTLGQREIADWHYHAAVTDDIFCLTGIIIVRMKDPREEHMLEPGERCQIKTGITHQLENFGDEEATYLLVQGIGEYDFNIVEN